MTRRLTLPAPADARRSRELDLRATARILRARADERRMVTISRSMAFYLAAVCEDALKRETP